jgi:hypothetical protein
MRFVASILLWDALKTWKSILHFVYVYELYGQSSYVCNVVISRV